MEVEKETVKIMTENQETESLENPFNQLAPEVVAHILSFLTRIPSQMSASGVCRLWRKLVDWEEVKQLQLDFERMRINDVRLRLAKWSTALESLLPKLKLASLKALLPSKTPRKPSKGSLYLPWPLYLLDCGLAVNQLTNQQSAALSHITHVGISGRPDNPEFELVCHLLELCPSLTHLNLSLASDKFDQALLKSALTKKPLAELDINISHLTGKGLSDHLAHLCHVLAPGTLKSLTLNIGDKDDKEHPYIFGFDEFFNALQTDANCRQNPRHCTSGLRSLIIGTPRRNPPTPTMDVVEQMNMDMIQMWSMLVGGDVPSVVNLVFPSLNMINFTISACDPKMWLPLHTLFANISKQFNRPLGVSLSTSHCRLFYLYLNFKSVFATPNPVPTQVQITSDGFDCINVRGSAGKETAIKFHYKRLPPVGPSGCRCLLCMISDYGWVKQQIINRLNGEGSGEQIQIFACHIPNLQVDLVDEFPSLSVSLAQNGYYVKIKAQGKSMVSAEVIQHNSHRLGNICFGCGMLAPFQ